MLIVQKYGGTSVGSIERMRAVAERAVACKREGNDVVVIVSAMSGETDRLIALAKSVQPVPTERELDMLLSTGERVSASLVAMAIENLGQKALSLTGRQVGIVTDTAYTKAKIQKVTGERVKDAIRGGYIAVIAGFQGIANETSDVTTLGRGGSDLTAVAVAAALKADLCEIYTDVDGVYTADPNIVNNARKLEKISYDEMLELASLGAKVLQARSVEYAKKYDVPVVVRSSFNFLPGTLVVKEDLDMENVVVSGVAHDKNQVKITIQDVPDRPGIAATIFTALADKGIVVDMIVQNVSTDGKFTDISSTVTKADQHLAVETTKALADSLGARGVVVNDDIAKVSIVGVGMRTHCGVAAIMFKTLSDNNINIMMISTSEIKLSCVIDGKYTELAVRELHKAFELDKQ
ncbi:MAG: aspartate kinase [Nitrospirae bacterium]|uniref:aspartate kinase n=1 Tax=Candidatus Magnetobacterium casense TaxID=1455061 RepID=UPI00058DB5C9|nr:aspartate kinase [Candidatus Magnetobacterium casensis]MBF0337165.1 aspartate kinase [Nitrospirota bacterium]